MRINVISIAGTIHQVAGQAGRSINEDHTAFKLAAEHLSHEIQVSVLGKQPASDMTLLQLADLKATIERWQRDFDAVILLMGTDSMEEVAFFLDSTMELGKPLIITGAMRPQSDPGYDGLRNFHDAVLVASHPIAKHTGALVVMNEEIHLGRQLRKADSQRLSAFVSPAGPVGYIRAGRPQFPHGNLPCHRSLPIQLTPEDHQIPILTGSIGARFNPAHFTDCDGLVVAGMGTGTLPADMLRALADWRQETRKPVVITTRCLTGDNYDTHYYPGSQRKYEQHGLTLQGYEGLTPQQARIRLWLALNAKPTNEPPITGYHLPTPLLWGL
ncbi:L-asparaginase [Ferrimonas marina]|uniref:L-asparaginase n=2 Tax=Ferrimonas marina TaxID=299255 RepID=A0A1M5TNQ0_9GAMM|nr:L-asparaginase [Ferrimonas marina]